MTTEDYLRSELLVESIRMPRASTIVAFALLPDANTENLITRLFYHVPFLME